MYEIARQRQCLLRHFDNLDSSKFTVLFSSSSQIELITFFHSEGGWELADEIVSRGNNGLGIKRKETVCKRLSKNNFFFLGGGGG
jgi:hypothetical protein